MNSILEYKVTGTGFTVHGESVMLDKYGDVYPTIDNKMHPNPGSKEEGYPEIERCVDWLYLHDFRAIKATLDEWIKIRVADEMNVADNLDLEEITHYVLFDDNYNACEASLNAVKEAYNLFIENDDIFNEYVDKNNFLINESEKIADFINERFLRVRAGGKLNPEGANSIYFRISSHGYDWHRVIVDFLWDIFKDPKDMPERIWIGHDAETNPPEVVLFDGTPNELFEKFDEKIFENDNERKSKENILKSNFDRLSSKLNKFHRIDYKLNGLKYTPFK